MRKLIGAAVMIGLAACASSQVDQAEVEKVVSGVKANQSDFRAFCLKARDDRAYGEAEVVKVLAQLMEEKKVSGDAEALGQAAGQAIASECRG